MTYRYVNSSTGSTDTLLLQYRQYRYGPVQMPYPRLLCAICVRATVLVCVCVCVCHTQVADIAAGGWHSLALTVDGELFAWGRGEYGRLGIGDPTGSSKLRPHKVRP